MEKRSIRRREKLYISSANRVSGTLTDFFVTFPPIDNVVGLEWSSQFHVGDQKIISIDGFNSSRHSSGLFYWRILDSHSNQRAPTQNWEVFPEDSPKQKLRTLHVMLYDMTGTPTSTLDGALTDPWGIEFDVFCMDD
jgi:hypothetical protein